MTVLLIFSRNTNLCLNEFYGIFGSYCSIQCNGIYFVEKEYLTGRHTYIRHNRGGVALKNKGRNEMKLCVIYKKFSLVENERKP